MPSPPPTSVTDPAATVPGKARQNKNGSRNKAAPQTPGLSCVAQDLLRASVGYFKVYTSEWDSRGRDLAQW